MSNIISSLNAGSGIDVTNLISSLVEVERAPTETRLDEREAKLDAQISAYGAFKSALSEFQSLIGTVADNETFNARAVTFPDSDAITPNSIEAGAQVGSYQVEVESVAAAQSLALTSAADDDETLGYSGNLTLEFGAWTYGGGGTPPIVPVSFAVNSDRDALVLDIDTNDSLNSIAQKINDADVGLTASVLDIDGTFQLMVTAPSGASNALRVTGDDASLDALTFDESIYLSKETQQAADAVIYVNGLQVTRDSNEMSDVIKGFSFTVNKSTEGQKVAFTVEADTEVADQAIRAMVEGFNLFVETAKGITGYSRDEDNNLVRGDLATDSVAKSLVSRLRESMTSQVTGATGAFSALAAIGINTNLDGSLSIDEKTFTNALKSNFKDMEALFAPVAKPVSTRIQVGQGSQIDRAESGTYAINITQDATQGKLTGAPVTADFGLGVDTDAGDYSFTLKVSGTSTGSIVMSGNYTDAGLFADDLEALINADANLAEKSIKVDVVYDPINNQFEITNRRYGSVSTVEITANGGGMASLGLTTAQAGVDGVDVEGTIAGEAGFGAGQVLLPSIGSPAYGLTFTVLDGAAAEGASNVSFSRGVAGELNLLIDRFLSNSGPIASREDSIETQLDKIDDDREVLDRRIEAYEARLTAQFIAMERIISSLNATDTALEGLADRLVFTAKR